jgi:hypothetical protein
MKINKALRAGLATIFLAAFLPAVGCRGVAAPTLEDSMVMIVEPGNPENVLAYGVVFAYGFYALTVLDYEDYTAPNQFASQVTYDLEAVSPKHGRFSAAVAAIDPRTGATLLYLKGEQPGQSADFPNAKLGQTTSLTGEQDVLIQGWGGPDDVFAAVEATASFGDSPGLMFKIGEPLPESNGKPFVGGQGAVITDKDNNVLGLIGHFGSYKLVMRTGFPGMLPPAVSIDAAKKLKGNTMYDYSSGPAVIVAGNEKGEYGDYIPGIFPLLPLSTDEGLADAILRAVHRAGAPLEVGPLSFDCVTFFTGTQSVGGGTVVVAAFPHLIDITDGMSWTGNRLATAKWVGIQFGRQGQPDRLLYGAETYVVEGAFALSDVSGVAQALPSFSR